MRLINRSLFWIIGGALLMMYSCAPADQPTRETQEEEYDTQYLPDGVEIASHQIFEPTGDNFQGQRIHPPFWWTDMEHDTLQLLIYDRNIKDSEVTINARGIELLDVESVENPNYLFVTLHIGNDAIPGRFPIQLSKDEGLARTYTYQLQRRLVLPGRIDPVSSEDLMYLIMPDRFANGDPDNDSFEAMRQTGVDRSKMYFRHGGDLQGIIDHLDYLSDMGVTAIWLTPVVENDQPYASYHGYAATDLYTIDPRFGSNDLYLSLASQCQSRGIKLVKDLVFNHVGHMHWFIQDIPDRTWIHQFDHFTHSNFAIPSVRDPYASGEDKRRFSNGWFDYSMPDLNQKHPLLATYLIQHAIWWVEFAGVDAYRLDTYPFADQDFMRKMGRELLREYPDFYYFGETTVHNIPFQAQFIGTSAISEADNPLPGVTDFMLQHAIEECFTSEPDWNTGVQYLYYLLASDFMYTDPLKNVTFLDNHDKTRFLSAVKNDTVKLKSALTLLMTLRGIPCIYYGTEFGFAGENSPDGKLRPDIQGGWSEDETNMFQESGRTPSQQSMFTLVSNLARARKESIALQSGFTTHWAPSGKDGIYAFVRAREKEQYFIVFNSTSEDAAIPIDRYRESIGATEIGFEITMRQFINIQDTVYVPAYTTYVIDTNAE